MADVAANFQDFDPYNDLPEYFFCIYYGLRRSGKTTMLRSMLYEMRDRLEGQNVYLFSTTAEVTPEDYKYIPKKAKKHNLGELEHELGKIIHEQKAKMKKYHDGDSAEEPAPILIILDDCVSENTIRHCPSLNTLAVAGRHLHMSVVVLSQVVTGSGSVPPIVRTQADAIFVVAQPRSERERALIAEQYLTSDTGYNSKRRGLDVMGAVTDVQYRGLVILTTDSSARRFDDYLLTYGPVDDAQVDSDFRLGTDEQWDDGDKKPKRMFTPSSTSSNQPMSSKMNSLPDPFSLTPDLAKDTNDEYIWRLSEQLQPQTNNRRGRRIR